MSEPQSLVPDPELLERLAKYAGREAEVLEECALMNSVWAWPLAHKYRADEKAARELARRIREARDG